MTTMTFLVNGSSIGHTKSAAWVTVNEMEGGMLSFKVVQSGGTMDNLHGVFFDVADEGILNTLRINTVSSDACIGDNSNNKLGCVTNMDGSPCRDNDYDVGLEIERSEVNRKNVGSYSFIEKSEIGKKLVSSYSFTLSSTKRELLLSDFCNIQLDYSEAGSDANRQCGNDYSHRWLYMGLV